jgi:(p)ppGpp synthase/HD superfamily hydrolase
MKLTSRFEDALVYAVRLHARQLRKGTDVPYASHLLGVASIALEFGAGEDEAIAALLHDAVEDQGGAAALAEIRARFGDAVAEIVAGCSDSEVIPKPPWRERKQAYLAHIAEAPASTRLVSAADKLHNARAINADRRRVGPDIWKRFNSSREDLLWYYRSLVEAFRAAGGGPLIEELGVAVDEMHRLAAAG